MNDWLWCISGWLSMGLFITKLILVCWCLVELHRNWRAVPELWSIDWLDIVYRLERDLSVTLTARDFEGWSTHDRIGLTARELWELVAAKLRDAGIVPPLDGWERVVSVLSVALNVDPERIIPDARLYADLGMLRGID